MTHASAEQSNGTAFRNQNQKHLIHLKITLVMVANSGSSQSDILKIKVNVLLLILFWLIGITFGNQNNQSHFGTNLGPSTWSVN